MTTLDFMDLTSEVGKVRDWLWHKRLPQGRVVVIDGDPAVSKSLFTVTVGAILSRGDELPFTEDSEPVGPGVPKTVVYLNYEDDALDIANRAVNAGADLAYFHAIKPLVSEGDDTFLIRWPEDRDSLRDLIQMRKVDVLVIDPMSTFFSGLKMNDTGNMSQAMAEVNQLATETNCTIIMIRHIGKGGGGGKPTSAGLGSVSITGTTRVGYILAADPDDPDLAILAPSKFNCGKKPNAISYRINEVNGFPVVEWVGESELTATQLLGQFEQKSRAAEARDYILDALGVGPVWRAELWEEFASFHASDDERERQALEKVFERAFTKLRKKPNKMVESLSCGRQGSIWRLWDADPAADRFHRDAAEKLRYHGGGELFEQVSPPT